MARVLRMDSRWSLASRGSILSIASDGSIRSIGSVGSVAIVGSIGSAVLPALDRLGVLGRPALSFASAAR